MGAVAQVPAAQIRQRAFDGVGDVSDLFAKRSGDVRALVRADVRASDPLIEDACQIAWSRLLRQRERVSRDTAIAWLVTTAVREAFKLIRRESRDLSLEALLEQAGESEIPGEAPSAYDFVEPRLRLGALRSLPERQAQLVWLQGVGLSYAEMAARTGATSRTVERQLLRARRRLHADADAEGETMR